MSFLDLGHTDAEISQFLHFSSEMQKFTIDERSQCSAALLELELIE